MPSMLEAEESMSVTYGRGPKGRATRLHSEYVRKRDGRCMKCGDNDPAKLQCAHIIGRRFAATRVDPANAIALCWTCHHRFTDHPDEWVHFIFATIGEAEFQRLKTKALAGVKTNDAFWLAECARLKSLLELAAVEGGTP